jgi:hypothetical protein
MGLTNANDQLVALGCTDTIECLGNAIIMGRYMCPDSEAVIVYSHTQFSVIAD